MDVNQEEENKLIPYTLWLPESTKQDFLNAAQQKFLSGSAFIRLTILNQNVDDYTYKGVVFDNKGEALKEDKTIQINLCTESKNHLKKLARKQGVRVLSKVLRDIIHQNCSENQ